LDSRKKQVSITKPIDLEKPSKLSGYRVTKDGRLCFITKAGEVCLSLEETKTHDLAISVLKTCPIYRDMKDSDIEGKYQELLQRTIAKGGNTVYHSKSREVKSEE